jgi:hypothetical protein
MPLFSPAPFFPLKVTGTKVPFLKKGLWSHGQKGYFYLLFSLSEEEK